MEQYFQEITESLSIEDVSILGILYDGDCTVRVKAMINSSLYHNSNLSEAIYRKVMGKLVAVKFVEAHTESKEHSFFITEYGKEAIANVFQISDRSEQI